MSGPTILTFTLYFLNINVKVKKVIYLETDTTRCTLHPASMAEKLETCVVGPTMYRDRVSFFQQAHDVTKKLFCFSKDINRFASNTNNPSLNYYKLTILILLTRKYFKIYSNYFKQNILQK